MHGETERDEIVHLKSTRMAKQRQCSEWVDSACEWEHADNGAASCWYYQGMHQTCSAHATVRRPTRGEARLGAPDVDDFPAGQFERTRITTRVNTAPTTTALCRRRIGNYDYSTLRAQLYTICPPHSTANKTPRNLPLAGRAGVRLFI